MSNITLEKLALILQSTGFPVAYSHFVESENDPLPAPPFITYLVAYSSNFGADNSVYYQIRNVSIELYTDTKDLETEQIVEHVLNENELFYQSTETYIESEQLYQKIYEVRLL
jgi:hypothetical protein